MQIYIAAVLTIVAVVMGVLQFWPKTSISQEQPYLFPLVTMLVIDVISLMAPQPVNMLYKGAILVGLLISTFAVVFYHLRKMPGYVAIAHLFIVYFVYFVAFSSSNRLAIPSPIILLVVAYAVLVFWLGRDELREAQGAFAGYIVLMSLMLWAASEVWVQHQELWATAAFAGAILLVVGSTILLVDKTRRPLPWSILALAITFYGGQLLIALSIWGFGAGTT